MKFLISFLNGLFILALVSGCAPKKEEKLQDAADMYVKSLARGDTNAMLSMVTPANQMFFFDAAKSMDKLHVSGVELDQIIPDADGKKALMSVRMDLFRPEAIGVESITRIYSLVYEEKAKRWLVDEKSPLGHNLKAKPTKTP